MTRNLEKIVSQALNSVCIHCRWDVEELLLFFVNCFRSLWVSEKEEKTDSKSEVLVQPSTTSGSTGGAAVSSADHHEPSGRLSRRAWNTGRTAVDAVTARECPHQVPSFSNDFQNFFCHVHALPAISYT